MDSEIRTELKNASDTIIKLFNKVQNEDDLRVMRAGIRDLVNNFENNFENVENKIHYKNRVELEKLKKIAELLNS